MPMMLPASVDEQAILDVAENKIRDHARLAVKNVVAIGETLVEVKSRVQPGRYTEFVTQRLGWNERTTRRFIAVYQMFCTLPTTQSLDCKTDKSSALDQLQIPVSALYKLAQPCTPEEVRAQVLEKAAQPRGVSLKETVDIIRESRQLAASTPPIEIP